MTLRFYGLVLGLVVAGTASCRPEPAVSENTALASQAQAAPGAAPEAEAAHRTDRAEAWLVAAHGPMLPQPDTRLVDALSRVDLLSAADAPPVSARRVRMSWEISSAGDVLATWSSFVEPAEVEALLEARVRVEPAPQPGAAPDAASAVRLAEPSALLAVLVQLGSDAFVGDPARVEAAADALSALVLLAPRHARSADALASVALAVCAVGRTAHGLPLTLQRARLWHALGYVAYARELAADLPASVERSYLLGDFAGLEASAAVATGWDGTLYMRARAERVGHGADAAQVLATRGNMADTVTLGLIWERLTLGERRVVADAWPTIVAAAARREAEGQAPPPLAAQQDDELVRALNGLAPAEAVAGATTTGAGLVTSALHAWEVSGMHQGWRDVEALAFDQLSMPDRAAAVLAAMPPATEPALTAWARAYGLRINVRQGAVALDDIAAAVENLGPIEGYIASRLLEAVEMNRNPYLATAQIPVVSIVAAIDGRPDSRRAAFELAWDGAHDFTVARQAAEAFVAQSPGVDSTFELMWYGRDGNYQMLERALGDAGRSAAERMFAARTMAYHRGDAAEATATVVALSDDGEGVDQDFSARMELVTALNADDPERAITELRSWLAGDEDAPAMNRAYIAASLAEALRDVGRPAEALDAVEPFVAVYSADVLEQSSRALAELGRTDEATTRLRAALERYPRSEPLETALVETLVGTGDLAGAAESIQAFGAIRPGNGLTARVQSAVFRGLAERPHEDGAAMVEALLAQGYVVRDLSSLASAATSAGRYDIAYQIWSRVPVRGIDDLEAVVRAWAALRHETSDAEATAWFRSQLTPQRIGMSAMYMHRNHAWELLWDALELSPDDHEHGSAYNWLLRAAALDAQHDPALAQETRTYFAEGPDDHYHRIGRYLTDQGTLEAVVDNLRSANERAEATYFIGLRAWREHRYVDATNWYLIAYDTGAERMGERMWAWDALSGIWSRSVTPDAFERRAADGAFDEPD